MNRRRMSFYQGLGLAFAMLMVTACGTVPAVPTQTVAPSEAPIPTDTPLPAPMMIPTTTLKPRQVRGEVVRVLDSDTIEVNVDGEILKVCYVLIIPPKSDDELVEQALEANRQLVEGQNVILEARPDDKDQPNCSFRYVFLEDGTFVNAEMLRLGLAKYTSSLPLEYGEELDSAQQEAMALGIGVWSEEPEATSTTATTSVESFALGDIRITDLSYIGVKDEYIEIQYKPLFGKPIVDLHDLSGWQIVAEGTGKVFVFPQGVELLGGSTCRIYTDEPVLTCDRRELSFMSSTEVWRDEGDCAYLFNPDSELEAKYCY